MKKILYLLILFAYVIGLINGIGYSCYIHQYMTAICVFALGLMAFPTAYYYWHKLMD